MMITCTACGSANAADDTFCGSCSAFLEWDGAPVADGVPVGAAASASGAAAATVSSGSGPVAAQEVPSPPIEPAELEHRAPQHEASRPAPRRAVMEGPTDQFCGGCGAGNAAGRAFCRRCGTPLDDPEAQQRPGWFARWVRPLWPFGRRRAREAGERPRSWERNAARQERRKRFGLRLPNRLLSKLAIPLMVLSLFGLGLSPMRAKATTWAFDTYDSIRRQVSPELVEVTPAAAVGDSEMEGHPALAAIDQNSSSYWSEAREGPGIGAGLTVSFASPTDLSQVGVLNGATETTFAKQPRLRTVQVEMLDVAGNATTERLDLADTADFRTYPLVGSAVSTVTITVLDVYPGLEGEDASLTEVSFHVSR